MSDEPKKDGMCIHGVQYYNCEHGCHSTEWYEWKIADLQAENDRLKSELRQMRLLVETHVRLN